MAQLESRLGLLTTAKVSCATASEKAGYFFKIAGYAFLMFANIVNLPTFSEYIVIGTANIFSD